MAHPHDKPMPGGVKESAKRGIKTLKKILTGDSKKKSGADPHGRTKKEKVSDFAKGVGLTSGQKKARDFIEGGLLKVTGVADLSRIPKKVGSLAKSIVKKAQAHKKE